MLCVYTEKCKNFLFECAVDGHYSPTMQFKKEMGYTHSCKTLKWVSVTLGEQQEPMWQLDNGKC